VYGLSVEVLAIAGFVLSIGDESKDSAGMTSDTSQMLPSSKQNMYILSAAKNLTPARDSSLRSE
jgi:hypothetical protein